MQLKVNGRDSFVPDDLKTEKLLWVLRDHLHLTGTKYGCGQALCGACTVHVGGAAMRSCQLVVEAVADREITTIEGLAAWLPRGRLHPVQEAFIAEQVPQCGYCIPGQIMTAVSLLKQNPNPTDDDIREAMRGNICRCGTYGRIRKAVRRAANGG